MLRKVSGIIFFLAAVFCAAHGIPAAATAQQTCDDTTGDLKKDKDALVALYNSTGGANWTQKSGWDDPTMTPLQGTQPWYGVFMDTTLCRVEKILLGNNGLSGTIPDLSDLTKLEQLKLERNSLSGTIPDLSDLTELTQLRLDQNSLSGTIPDLSDLTKLEWLNLSLNSLSGTIPAGLSTALTNLNLQKNSLSGTISAMSSLTKLKELYLNENSLSGTIPAGLSTDLIRLELHQNNLSGTIPSDLNTLTKLGQTLNLSRNNLSGTIPDLSALSNLERLNLSGNRLGGEITPADFPTSLQYLYLHSNDLSGTIPVFTSLTNLQWLELYGNRLSGEITPADFPTSLRVLNLQSNSLSGTIPDFTSLNVLWWLNLGGNSFSGEIPVANFPATMGYLELHSNNLSGEIPDLTPITLWWGLRLSANSLSGEITPADFSTTLQYLYLHSNNLSGGIPDLSALTNLKWLYLGDNSLGGEITPADFPTSLKRLYLHSAGLSGEIPALSTLTNLQRLYLHNNSLSGEIPALSALTELTQVGLDQNSLSGEIPDLSALTKLEWLYLDRNSLSGTITPAYFPASLINLYLHNNDLTGSGGSLSPDFTSLTELKELALWGNTIPGGGAIPGVEMSAVDRAALRVLYNNTGGQDWKKNVGWLTSAGLGTWQGVTTDAQSGRVTALDLSGNGLKNPVSNSLEALNKLTALNLSDNAKLAGKLPERLEDISGLSSLNIECTGVQTPSATEWPPNDAPRSFLLEGCPGKPVSGRVVPGILSLTVSWTAATGADGYKVQWKSGDQDWDETDRQNTVSGGSTTTSEITGLASGVEYTVRVIATKGNKDGTPGEEVKGTPNSPPSAPPPPPPPPPAPAPPTPVSPDGSTLITEAEDDEFAFTPVGGESSVVYGAETIEFTVTGNDGPSPTIILPRAVLDAVADAGGSVTFDVSAGLSGDPPSGFRLGGLVVDIDLGIELEAGESVVVCLPADVGVEDPVLHHYDEESGTWEPLAEQETVVLNGVRSVCGKTDAFSRFGLFVAEEDPVPPPAVGESGGGCAVAGAGSRSVIPTADLLSAGLLLLAAVSFRRRALRRQRKHPERQAMERS